MKRILTMTAMFMASLVGTAQAQDNTETRSDKMDKPATATASDHNSTRSNKLTLAGPDGGLSEKEKCEAEGGVWRMNPGASKGFCLKTISPSGEAGMAAAPANDFNSSRSNKTATITPNGPDLDSEGGKAQEATDYNSSRSNKSFLIDVESDDKAPAATDYNSSRSNKADGVTESNDIYDDDGNLVNRKRVGKRN